VTFDADLRDKALRGRCRVLHLKGPERSSRDRLAAAIDTVVDRFNHGSRLVTVRRSGRVDAGR
jgi:hypothetical protein